MARMRRRVTEWARKPGSTRMPTNAVEAIARRRRQILVHSCLYYAMNQSVIDDHTWNKWAQQLDKLQDKFGWEIGFYDGMFADWNGSSGYHLTYDDDVRRVAARLLEYYHV